MGVGRSPVKQRDENPSNITDLSGTIITPNPTIQTNPTSGTISGATGLPTGTVPRKSKEQPPRPDNYEFPPPPRESVQGLMPLICEI